MKHTWYKTVLLILVAPFFIIAWAMMNPKAVWAEAKKEWNK